ncbi:putative ABC transporter ATP-binding protein YheS [Streptomyces sp. ADI96-15]|uniref:ABC-F family ATP-binding cassette domain-containing protein n=1 Tax=Streptomyces sp. ADI96-15 TaxID=1522761 RepID=UPI000F553023|nr:ABC-F family ATP-binding cassette domain-containing protein [Streptomyces sp. ADI96-15]RPK65352.1 putative ABC transporter ATP-binding protein YheS [Streptomyces sp. ADI96-15]
MPEPALLAHELVRVLGGRRVLDGVSLTAAPRRRIGLIGENGVGKSTLLRLLAGTDRPDSGHVVRPADLGVLHQELPYDPASTLADVLDGALREARTALTELDRLTGLLETTPQDTPEYAALLTAYGRQLESAERQEVWEADRRAAAVLAGLGLGALDHGRSLASLSGGQRGRLALAALLVRRPSALLLDEPTNHLDDEAAAFLEERLRELPGTVVAASHDRAFLDAVCTDLIDLDPAPGGPVRHGGTYSSYLAGRRAERARWERRYAEEQEELALLRRAADTSGGRAVPGRDRPDNEKMGYGHRAGRAQTQLARRARDAHRRLELAERRQVAAPTPVLRLRFAGPAATAPPDPAHGPLVAVRDLRVPGRLSLPRLDVTVGDRLLVSGGNGTGKSTLLAALAGRLDQGGEVRHRPGLRVGLLAQDTRFRRPERTARTVYAEALGAARAEAVPLSQLGLLAAADLDKPVAELSVGQRRRLALALLVAHPPELLLLDEPTNHLSPRLSDELEAALGPGPGAVVMASHDRWLRARWRGRELRLGSRG